MKCPKCKQTMDRKKLKENNYYYECPRCHTVVGKKEETRQEGRPEDTQDS